VDTPETLEVLEVLDGYAIRKVRRDGGTTGSSLGPPRVFDNVA